MEPQKWGLEDDFPFRKAIFRFHVKFRWCNPATKIPFQSTPPLTQCMEDSVL